MADVTFRTATPPNATKEAAHAEIDTTPGTSQKGDTSTKLVATYEEATGTPYTAQYYDITNIWQEEKGGFKEEVRNIEYYLQQQVAAQKLDNSLEAADKWYSEAEKRAGIAPEESTAIKLIKLAAYVRMQQDIDSAMEWRKLRG